jgi:hypothetical protein
VDNIINEHIKDIAYQADLLDDDGWNTSKLHITIEKFADLLINESIDALEKEYDTLPYGRDYETGYQHGFESAISFLSKHFKTKQIPKICPQKVDGHCPLHNLFCQYPDCEK